jgi:hypothetical protein
MAALLVFNSSLPFENYGAKNCGIENCGAKVTQRYKKIISAKVCRIWHVHTVLMIKFVFKVVFLKLGLLTADTIYYFWNEKKISESYPHLQ